MSKHIKIIRSVVKDNNLWLDVDYLVNDTIISEKMNLPPSVDAKEIHIQLRNRLKQLKEVKRDYSFLTGLELDEEEGGDIKIEF